MIPEKMGPIILVGYIAHHTSTLILCTGTLEIIVGLPVILRFYLLNGTFVGSVSACTP
jgi:hypothetical protein